MPGILGLKPVTTNPSARRVPRTAAASEKQRELGAERAIDDPVKLAKAARIVRLALARQRLTLDELTEPSTQDEQVAA